MSDFVIWSVDVKNNFASVGGAGNVKDAHELKRGVSRSKGFPDDAFFRMDPKRPKAVKLPDNVFNLPRVMLVSSKLKEAIEEAKPPKVEYLRVKILDHKERVAADDYFIVNPVDLVDCIDKEKSEVGWNKLEPDRIMGCAKLVIDESRIDKKLILLRPKHLSTIVLVRRSFAEQLQAAEVTGLKFQEVKDFRE